MQTQSTEFDLNINPGAVKSAMKSADASSRDLWQVSPDKLHVIEGFNVRVKDAAYFAHVRSLANSMIADGYYQHEPIGAFVERNGDEQVISVFDGHCRLEAVRLAISEGADITKVPVVVSQAGVSREDLTVALVRGNKGKELTPYETAIVCKRLVRYGYDEKEVSKRLDFSLQHVKNLLSLVAAPYQLQQLVIEGTVSATTAIEVIAKYKGEALSVLLRAGEKQATSGKKRVTSKSVDSDAELNKRIRKHSKELYELLKLVADGAGSAMYYQRITDLLKQIEGD